MPCTTTTSITTAAIAIKQTKVSAPAGVCNPEHRGEDVIVFEEGGFLHNPISGHQRWQNTEVPSEFLEKFPPPHHKSKIRQTYRGAKSKQLPCDLSDYIEKSHQRIEQSKQTLTLSTLRTPQPPHRPFCNERELFLCNPYSAYGLFKKCPDWYFDCNVGPRGLWVRRAPPSPVMRPPKMRKSKGVNLRSQPEIHVVEQDEISLVRSTSTAAIITGFTRSHITFSDGFADSGVSTVDAFATLTSSKELKEKRSPSAHRMTRATLSLMKYN